MNRRQLEQLGEAPLRHFAQQVGLAQADGLSRAALIEALARHFESLPPAPEDDDPADGPEPREPAAPVVPPAFATGTMLRLMEAQGLTQQAAHLRMRLTPAPRTRAGNGYSLTATVASGNPAGLVCRVEGPEGAAALTDPLDVEIHEWAPGAAVRITSYTTAQTPHDFEHLLATATQLPAGVLRAQRTTGRVILARTPLIRLAPTPATPPPPEARG